MQENYYHMHKLKQIKLKLSLGAFLQSGKKTLYSYSTAPVVHMGHTKKQTISYSHHLQLHVYMNQKYTTDVTQLQYEMC